MNAKMANKPIPRLARLAVAVLLIAALLASCGPQVSQPIATPPPGEPTAAPAEPTAVPPTPVPAEPTAVPPTEVPAAPAEPTPVPASATSADPAYYSSAPVPVVPPGQPGMPMVEAAYNTTIRGGPGTNYVVYGAFNGGSTAIALGTSTDYQWYVISVPPAPNGIGWVPATYLIAYGTSGLPVYASPSVPPTVELVPPAEGDPQAVSLTEVYVRTGPGDTYPAYGIAKSGSVARVIGKSADGYWLTVRLNPENVGMGYGWVATAYTQPTNIESVQIIAAPDQAPPVYYPPVPSGVATATAIDYVNIRSGPGYNYLIYGVVSPGTTGEVIGKSQDGLWWQVKTPSLPTGNAWVSADWVVTSNTQSVPVVEAPPPPPTTVEPTPPPAGSCVLVSQSPADYTNFPPRTGFGVQWTLQNTGSTPWSHGEFDIVYQGAIDGMRLHQNGDLYDLPQTVNPGETITLSGSLITPDSTGQWGEAWAIQQGGAEPVCTFWIIVNVQ